MAAKKKAKRRGSSPSKAARRGARRPKRCTPKAARRLMSLRAQFARLSQPRRTWTKKVGGCTPHKAGVVMGRLAAKARRGARRNPLTSDPAPWMLVAGLRHVLRGYGIAGSRIKEIKDRRRRGQVSAFVPEFYEGSSKAAWSALREEARRLGYRVEYEGDDATVYFVPELYARQDRYNNPVERRGVRAGTRLRFSPTPASLLLYSRHPPAGAVGTVVSIPLGGRKRGVSLPGPGGGLVYVDWDGHGVQGVSPLDVERVGKHGEPVHRNPSGGKKAMAKKKGGAKKGARKSTTRGKAARKAARKGRRRYVELDGRVMKPGKKRGRVVRKVRKATGASHGLVRFNPLKASPSRKSHTRVTGGVARTGEGRRLALDGHSRSAASALLHEVQRAKKSHKRRPRRVFDEAAGRPLTVQTAELALKYGGKRGRKSGGGGARRGGGGGGGGMLDQALGTGMDSWGYLTTTAAGQA